MAGVLNFTPSVIFRPLSRFRREPNSRVSYVRSSAETPAVTSKEEPPRLGVSSPTTPSFSPPPNFKPPQPKRFFIRPDKLFDILGASLALIFRLGTGVVVSGYSPSFVSKDEISSDQYALEIAGFKVKETSKLGPRPEMPIEIYEFESCPFCRKVREIIAVLDLDVLYYPCPKNGPNFRQKAVQMGGKKQFPYMVDPNTGVAMYESDDIIKYLVGKYGDGNVPLLLSLGLLTTLTEGFAMIGRMGKGGSYTPSKLPPRPLELWAYGVRLRITEAYLILCSITSGLQREFNNNDIICRAENEPEWFKTRFGIDSKNSFQARLGFFESILIFRPLYELNMSYPLFAHLEYRIFLTSLIHTYTSLILTCI